MLVSTLTTLALRCPDCGKIGFHALSRFSLGQCGSLKIDCECGNTVASVCRKGNHVFCLQVDCMMCDERHVYTYRSRELWQGGVIALLCEHNGAGIGFIGSREAVLNNVRKADRSVREIAEEMGYDKYFANPEIMYRVLEALHAMTDQGKMSCSCGGDQLDVEVFSDRVELSCVSCDAVGIVFAETTRDLRWLESMSEICLEAHTYRYLDEKRQKNTRRKNPAKK